MAPGNFMHRVVFSMTAGGGRRNTPKIPPMALFYHRCTSLFFALRTHWRRVDLSLVKEGGVVAVKSCRCCF
jgi:hypothetical protein